MRLNLFDFVILTKQRSPSGRYLVTQDDDHSLNIFELLNHRIELTNKLKSSTPIINFFIHSINFYYTDQLPIFLSTRDKPLQLLNGLNGAIHSSYNLIKNDAFLSPFDLFQLGDSLFCSSKSSIYKFNINNSNDFECFNLKQSQSGIISSIDFNSLYVASGDLSNNLAIYTLDFDLVLLLTDLPQSIIQLKWLSESLIIINFRHFDYLYIYDINTPSAPLNYLSRPSNTNQNFYFDLYYNWLISGDKLGNISFFNLSDLTLDGSLFQPSHSLRLSSDSINSISHHPHLPLISLTSNSRKFLYNTSDSSDTSDSDNDSINQVEQFLSFNLLIFNLSPPLQ